jgi:hypothetical protein
MTAELETVRGSCPFELEQSSHSSHDPRTPWPGFWKLYGKRSMCCLTIHSNHSCSQLLDRRACSTRARCAGRILGCEGAWGSYYPRCGTREVPSQWCGPTLPCQTCLPALLMMVEACLNKPSHVVSNGSAVSRREVQQVTKVLRRRNPSRWH